MRSKRLVSGLAGFAVSAALLLGGTAPAGVAQSGVCIDPNYCPEEPAVQSPTTDQQQLLKKCVKKAKKKFRNDATKKKAAIKKCKKKYG